MAFDNPFERKTFMYEAFARGSAMVTACIESKTYTLGDVASMVADVANEIEIAYGRQRGADKRAVVVALTTRAVQALSKATGNEAAAQVFNAETIGTMVDALIAVSKGKLFAQVQKGCCVIL